MDAMKKPSPIQPLVVEGYGRDVDEVVVQLGSNPDGSMRWIEVRPINTARFEDRLEARRRQYSRATLQSSPEIDKTLQKDTMAELAFASFGNFYPPGSFEADGKGGFKLKDGVEPYENSYENRRALLEDRDFYLDFIMAAGTPETFRRSQLEADLGNSPKSSTGS